MFPNNKRRVLFACVASIPLLYAGLHAHAQELEIAVSPSPVGSGARAAGMADAFVAIADDATAASWNPAGLIQLERPELSVVGSFNGISESFSAKLVGFDSDHDDQNLDLNYMSFVYPLPVLVANRNVTVSLNYQRKYDFSRNFDVTYLTGKGTLTNHIQFSFQQEGGLSAITPAIAMEITPKLSLGLSLNFWRSTPFAENSWTQKTNSRWLTLFGGTVIGSNSHTTEEYENLRGENFSLGALWLATDKLSFGARYDSPFGAEVDYRSVNLRLDGNSGALGLMPFARSVKEKRTVHFPATYAVGTAYRISDKFWMSLDVTRTDWNDFWVKNAAGTRRSLVDASNLDLIFDRSHFAPTTTIRLGAEYVMLPEELEESLDRLWTLRGGAFYDEEPANGHPDSFVGVAAGVGLLLNQRVNLDFAYQLRFGQGVNHDFFRGIRGFEEDVVQHRALLSTVIYF